MAPALTCDRCGREAPSDAVDCPCGGLLAVALPPGGFSFTCARFDRRRGGRAALDRSGVWRFREAIHPWASAREVVTMGEGDLGLVEHPALSAWAGVDRLLIKHEGWNPTGSFKDRGMTVAMTEAVRLKKGRVACASTGNTSASMAAYAARAGLEAVVFVPAGKVAPGKLAQAVSHGARLLEVAGPFDAAMNLVRLAARDLDLYLLNSVNPWRIEGQKAIVFEILQDLAWDPPDWIALPAGNLGNTAAFGKALSEALAAGLIDRLPRLLAVQAAGAAPFYRMWRDRAKTLVPETAPETVATAIRIGAPVSWERAARSIAATNGRVEAADDAEILAAKSAIDRAGIGCEPASAAAVAGLRRAVAAGAVRPSDRVVAVLTGHLLKDPEAGSSAPRPVRVQADIASVRAALG